jgi:hypothetical protein
MVLVKNIEKLLLAMSGFNNSGAGKLIGPDGNEMDNESFLSGLEVQFH